MHSSARPSIWRQPKKNAAYTSIKSDASRKAKSSSWWNTLRNRPKYGKASLVLAKPLADNRPRHLVSYSYAISGVTYHTAQDITGLEGQIRFERLVAGQPASVKYDPSNPSDSILVADDWSGLR
jgi:hypothetical protein